MLCVPSGFEAFPLVMVEAMARGVPVMAAVSGAIPEMLDDGRAGVDRRPAHPRGVDRRVRGGAPRPRQDRRARRRRTGPGAGELHVDGDGRPVPAGVRRGPGREVLRREHNCGVPHFGSARSSYRRSARTSAAEKRARSSPSTSSASAAASAGSPTAAAPSVALRVEVRAELRPHQLHLAMKMSAPTGPRRGTSVRRPMSVAVSPSASARMPAQVARPAVGHELRALLQRVGGLVLAQELRAGQRLVDVVARRVTHLRRRCPGRSRRARGTPASRAPPARGSRAARRAPAGGRAARACRPGGCRPRPRRSGPRSRGGAATFSAWVMPGAYPLRAAARRADAGESAA